MEILLKQQSKIKTDNSGCSITEYPSKNEKINLAIVNLNGRYPEERRVVNQECDELAYVSDGEGKIAVNLKEYKLSTGDVVLIEAGEKYYWEGNMTIILSCSPAWNVNQHEKVE